MNVIPNKFTLQLESYAKTEEAKVEELIKTVADSGAKVIVSGAAVGEMALHFCERYKYLLFTRLYCFSLKYFPSYSLKTLRSCGMLCVPCGFFCVITIKHWTEVIFLCVHANLIYELRELEVIPINMLEHLNVSCCLKFE